MFDQGILKMIADGTGQTIYMTIVATILAYIVGLPLGIVLMTTGKGGIAQNRAVNLILGAAVNIFRSIPFLILLVMLIPFTRMIVGSSIGTTATIVPLTVAAIPFVARLTESSLSEISPGIIEAARSMGASRLQIITKFLLPETGVSLIMGAAITLVTVLSYSAMAGFVGGGGLGAIAIQYGYHRYQTDIMLITVVILVVIVQVFQEFGLKIAVHFDRRK